MAKVTLGYAVPRELFQFLEVDDAGVEQCFEVFASLFGRVVFQVFVGLRLLDLLFAVEDVGDVQLLHHLSARLLSNSTGMYFLKSLKMDIK